MTKTSPLEFKGFTLKEKMSNGTAENLEDGDTTDNVEDDPTTTLNIIRTATGIERPLGSLRMIWRHTTRDTIKE